MNNNLVDIPAILNNSIYTIEREQIGHTIINGKGIEILKGNKKKCCFTNRTSYN